MSNTTIASGVRSCKSDPLAQRKRLTEKFRAENERCARIILENREKFGAGSLLEQWAESVLSGQQAATREWWRRTA